MITDAVTLKETSVNRQILEADVLINVPAAKVHAMATLTIGMKNLMCPVWRHTPFTFSHQTAAVRYFVNCTLFHCPVY
jgi:uncharacterized protein (DUF362 family)